MIEMYLNDTKVRVSKSLTLKILIYKRVQMKNKPKLIINLLISALLTKELKIIKESVHINDNG